MVVTAVTEPPGRLLEGRYRLGERIAAGGMGEVRRARDLVLGRAVAVKLPRPGYAGHAEGLPRFRAEARHAACCRIRVSRRSMTTARPIRRTRPTW